MSLSVCVFVSSLQGEAPVVRRVCQFGVSAATFDMADWMLSFADPPLEEYLRILACYETVFDRPHCLVIEAS